MNKTVFKNMKIEINDEQPLDEVVAELKVKGFRSCGGLQGGSGYIVTISKVYTWCCDDSIEHLWSKNKLKTLAELKEM